MVVDKTTSVRLSGGYGLVSGNTLGYLSVYTAPLGGYYIIKGNKLSVAIAVKTGAIVTENEIDNTGSTVDATGNIYATHDATTYAAGYRTIISKNRIISGYSPIRAAIWVKTPAVVDSNELIGSRTKYGVFTDSSSALGSVISRNSIDMAVDNAPLATNTAVMMDSNIVTASTSLTTLVASSAASGSKIINNIFHVGGAITTGSGDILIGNVSPGYLPAVYYSAALPVKGTYIVGDRTINSAPAVGQPKAWTATVAGGLYSTTRADATAVALGVWAAWSTGTTIWECTAAGTTGTGAPSIVGKNIGDTVTDGTVTWTKKSATTATLVSEGNL